MYLRFIVLILSVTFLYSCTGKYSPPLLTAPLNNSPTPPDYSKSESWAALPSMKDSADRVPAESKLTDNQQGALADVFFIHPTSFLKQTEKSIGWNAAVNDELINVDTDKGAILNQASIFNGAGKVYAPRYRQAFIYSYWTPEKEKGRKALDIAYEDVKIAFNYYLENYNQGRPFIIASHSQGTTHAIRLLQEFLDDKELSKKFIAAYLVGMDVFESNFKVLKPCRDENETGCYVGWRTYAQGYFPEGYVIPNPKPVVTNPLTWKTDSLYASRDLNKGGILRKFDKVIPAISDAQVLDGVLRINEPRFSGRAFFNIKNYHIVDYNLFYFNIRSNAENRVKKYLENRNGSGD